MIERDAKLLALAIRNRAISQAMDMAPAYHDQFSEHYDVICNVELQKIQKACAGRRMKPERIEALAGLLRLELAALEQNSVAKDGEVEVRLMNMEQRLKDLEASDA